MSSSSIVGVSSTPFLEVSAKRTATALFYSTDKFHFNALKPSKPLSLRSCCFRQTLSFIPSAIATPNSVLSEEAFKGLGDFNSSSLDTDDEEDYDDSADADVDVDDDELAISKLGLPDRLVQTLESRGITHLFPIQVSFFSFLKKFFVPLSYFVRRFVKFVFIYGSCVQRAVLVPALEGRDLIARAKTGTGKTLAFGIPIIKRLTEEFDEIAPSRYSITSFYRLRILEYEAVLFMYNCRGLGYVCDEHLNKHQVLFGYLYLNTYLCISMFL